MLEFHSNMKKKPINDLEIKSLEEIKTLLSNDGLECSVDLLPPFMRIIDRLLLLGLEQIEELDESASDEETINKLMTLLYHAVKGYETVSRKFKDTVISGFWAEEFPIFEQGMPHHELQSYVTADELNGLMNNIKIKLGRS